MFKTVEREAVTVYGWITTLNAPNSANGLAEMSKQKMRSKEEYASKVEENLLAVNCFNLNYKDQVELDQLIGRSYGELAQSEDFQIAGNFNLEEYTGVGKVLFYVPILKMKK